MTFGRFSIRNTPEGFKVFSPFSVVGSGLGFRKSGSKGLSRAFWGVPASFVSWFQIKGFACPVSRSFDLFRVLDSGLDFRRSGFGCPLQAY